MPDRDGMFEVGERHFDSDGIERVTNRWGFNSFASLDGTKASLTKARDRGGIRGRSHWFLWRLPDGSFDYSAIPESRTPPTDKVLVEEIDL